MNSNFLSRICYVYLLSLLFSNSIIAQPVWQNIEVPQDPYFYFTNNSLVNIGKTAHIGYGSDDLNLFGTCHFYALDSTGTKTKDTSFTSLISTGEGFRKALQFSNKKTVLVTSTDPSNNYREALTCFDLNGDFLWRTYGDSNNLFKDAIISNDSLFVFYKKVGAYYFDIYNDSGVLLNTVLITTLTTIPLKELTGIKVKSGILFCYGDEFLGNNDAQFYVRGVNMTGTLIFEEFYNPTSLGEVIEEIVVDDSLNVYFMGYTIAIGNIRFLAVGKFNKLGGLSWYSKRINGSVRGELLLKKNNLLVTFSFVDTTNISGRLDNYNVNNGTFSNLYMFDSLSNFNMIKMRDFSSNTILLGSSKGSFITPYCQFFEYNLFSNVFDTLYSDSGLVNYFTLMVPKDSTGFFYGRDNIITYFEKTITSISENEINNNSQLPYPNPFYDKLNLECKDTDIINFYEYSGRLCLSSVKSELDKNLPQLPKGNFIVEILNGALSKKFRLVKN
jgi:hypothetical protein